MSRPLPHPAQNDTARIMRESCARMVAEAEASLLAYWLLPFVRAVAGLFLSLADLFERWQHAPVATPAYVPAHVPVPARRARSAKYRAAPGRHRRPRALTAPIVRARARQVQTPAASPTPSPPPLARRIDRYPKP